MSTGVLVCAVCGRMRCGGHFCPADMQIEELRGAAAANYLRRERKLRVFKAIGWSGLTILFCGATLAIVYALGL